MMFITASTPFSRKNYVKIFFSASGFFVVV